MEALVRNLLFLELIIIIGIVFDLTAANLIIVLLKNYCVLGLNSYICKDIIKFKAL